MATPNRLQFFCTRPDGALTPLVAVDELPSGISIRGVSRNLNASETQGMTSCGLAAPRSDPWTVDGVVYSPRGSGAESVPEIHNFLLQVMGNANVPEHLRMSASMILFHGMDHSGARVGDGTASGSLRGPLGSNFYASPQPANKNVRPTYNHQVLIQCLTPPLQVSVAKKEYCSYWIRHGECDYAQQGR